MLNHVTWSPLAHFAHQPTVVGPATLVAYSEVEEDTGRRASQVSVPCCCAWFRVNRRGLLPCAGGCKAAGALCGSQLLAQ